MASSWKLTAFAPKPVIESALEAHSRAPDWDPNIVVSGFEVAEDRPEEWRLDAYLARQPTDAERIAIQNLFAGKAPLLKVQKLPDADWVSESQKGVEPIRAGKFYVHTPEFPPETDLKVHSLVIPASQAFGTGQHATTAGCLHILSEMARRGVAAQRIADIGTGTGLLAFAAMHLWPNAEATASDIDPICQEVIERNIADNGVVAGSGAGQLQVLIADGMNHPALRARAPFDLLVANILAGPLIDMAAEFADAVSQDGNLLLAGLLEAQEEDVTDAYGRSGFSFVERLINGDWSILWLKKQN